jgi:hypothetical protein
MMEDEDTGEKVACPYCEQTEDCSHLLITIDKTFGEWCGGYAYDRQKELSDAIDSAFRERVMTAIKLIRWNDISLNDLWGDAFQDFYPENMDLLLEPRPLFELMGDLFDDVGAIELNGVFEGGPGASSSLSSFYAKNPEVAFNKALKDLQKRLKT